MIEPKESIMKTEMTVEQILNVADPYVAMTALARDETKMLRTILALLCLDDKCKDLFEQIVREGYNGVPHYSSYGSDYDDVWKWLRQFRDRIKSESNDLRETLQECERLQDLLQFELQKCPSA